MRAGVVGRAGDVPVGRAGDGGRARQCEGVVVTSRWTRGVGYHRQRLVSRNKKEKKKKTYLEVVVRKPL